MATVLKFARKLDSSKEMETTLDAIIVEPSVIFPIPGVGPGDVGAMTRVAVVAAATAFKAALTAGKIVLFTNNIDPSPDLAFDQLVEPTGDWYTQQASVLGAVYEDADGNIKLTGASKQFTYSGVDPAETIRGWAYVDVTA